MSTDVASQALTGAVAIAAPQVRTVEAKADPRELRASPRLGRYLMLLGQLGLLLVVFKVYQLEEPAFFVLACTMMAGFAVHYWLPFRLKEPFWLLLSVGGAYLLLEPLAATILLAVGFGLFVVIASPLAYGVRVGMVAGVWAGLMYGRATLGFHIPYQFWPVFGAIFMFRMMIYLYDLRHLPGRPRFRDYVSYFFVLPNYYFLLFPVIDFQTLRRTYYQRDIHDSAQQGVSWIVRGTVQLLLYRLIYHSKGPSNAPDQITTFMALASSMVFTYMLYLRVSGQFHMIIGFLHLFGYDLPETHRKYLLSRSLTDFWRRINIYWKDFMVKLVYFPVYFKLRRGGETRAQVLATALVFTMTWLLHSYQWFWLRGELLFSWPDFFFWAILGLFVTINLLVERRRKPKKLRAGWTGKLIEALQVAGTFVLITIVWSMWNAPSLGEWADVVTWWRVG